MNSIWNKNKVLLEQRFPELYRILEETALQIDSDDGSSGKTIKGITVPSCLSFWNISEARSGEITATENGTALHSTYAPVKEAQRTASQKLDDGKTILAFCSSGLGYLPNEMAKVHPDKTFFIIEPDIMHFLGSLAFIDWTPVFSLEKCILLVNAPAETSVTLLQAAGKEKQVQFFFQQAQIKHASGYFTELFTLFRQNQHKDEINQNTLERFSGLWLRNSCRNLEKYQELDGVSIYFGKARGKIPAVILAAGPTLEHILPYLAEIKKRSIIICVDTALKACLRHDIEPDFIVLGDPQYYAAKHINGLHSPSSVLITEIAAYPSVFRLDCRKKVLFSSIFPLGKYMESRTGSKGLLCSGGSVSTTAWDFALALDPEAIYMAGLDLGFPQNKTHIKGSTFEERSHTDSTRIKPAETALINLLLSAKNEKAEDFNGQKIITDSRMRIFAWWFETKIKQVSESSKPVKTYTFSKDGLFINGMIPLTPDEFLKKPDIMNEKLTFFEDSRTASRLPEKHYFESAMNELKEMFSVLKELAFSGIRICSKVISERKVPAGFFNKLDNIDSQILTSKAKDIAALVFPTERQLEKIFSVSEFSDDKFIANAEKSKIIYSELLTAIEKYQANLK